MELNVGVFFDGTGNNRALDDDSMSNVGKLSYLYRDDHEQYQPGASKGYAMLYVRGVGTESDGEDDPIDNDFGEWQVGGAAFGAGGVERITYNLRRIENLVTDDVNKVVVDVFGFSRGAALARSFVNIVFERSFGNSFDRLKALPELKIRFVGIYDTVGSFGIPGDDDDPYNFHLDTTKARYIYQIAAQDELRKNFDLQSLRRRPAELLAFPIEATRKWMVEEAMPGVHSDIGGGYSSGPEQGNDNNELSRIYLAKMHRVAIRQDVPFHSIDMLSSIPGRGIPWKIDKALNDSFASLMGTYANDARLVRLHEHLKRAERHFEVVRESLDTYKNRKVTQSHGVKSLKERKAQLTSRIKVLKDHITKECFADNADTAKQFFTLYANFRRNYIHKSHCPFNTTKGMGPQLVERDKKSPIEKLINKVSPANGLLRIYKRDVFLNENKQATQTITTPGSLTCNLKFVSKQTGASLPANIRVEVWDDDFGPDDRIGAGVTNDNGEVEILCFDIDTGNDIYFAFEGEGASFSDNSAVLPDYWESRDHDSFKDGGGFEKGLLKNYEQDELGTEQNPFVVYV